MFSSPFLSFIPLSRSSFDVEVICRKPPPPPAKNDHYVSTIKANPKSHEREKEKERPRETKDRGKEKDRFDNSRDNDRDRDRDREKERAREIEREKEKEKERERDREKGRERERDLGGHHERTVSLEKGGKSNPERVVYRVTAPQSGGGISLDNFDKSNASKKRSAERSPSPPPKKPAPPSSDKSKPLPQSYFLHYQFFPDVWSLISMFL